MAEDGSCCRRRQGSRRRSRPAWTPATRLLTWGYLQRRAPARWSRRCPRATTWPMWPEIWAACTWISTL
eukprot:823103-Prymnesium_polylepis.1